MGRVRFFQSLIIAYLIIVAAFKIYDSVAITKQIQVHKQAGCTSVTVNKRMDAHKLIVQISGNEDWMDFLCLHFTEL